MDIEIDAVWQRLLWVRQRWPHGSTAELLETRLEGCDARRGPQLAAFIREIGGTQAIIEDGSSLSTPELAPALMRVGAGSSPAVDFWVTASCGVIATQARRSSHGVAWLDLTVVWEGADQVLTPPLRLQENRHHFDTWLRYGVGLAAEVQAKAMSIAGLAVSYSVQ